MGFCDENTLRRSNKIKERRGFAHAELYGCSDSNSFHSEEELDDSPLPK